MSQLHRLIASLQIETMEDARFVVSQISEAARRQLKTTTHTKINVRFVRKPSYWLHKPTGQGRVRIKGKDYYLGEYGSEQSLRRYRQLVESLLADGDLEFIQPKAPGTSHVYLIKHVNGLVKIGRSRKPKAREQTLQAEDPRLEMIGCFQAHNHIEKRLHSIFHDLRVRGEWFRLEDRHVEWIKLVLSNSESITQ